MSPSSYSTMTDAHKVIGKKMHLDSHVDGQTTGNRLRNSQGVHEKIPDNYCPIHPLSLVSCDT
eukprot:4732643-Amphidinium_carterae.1